MRILKLASSILLSLILINIGCLQAEHNNDIHKSEVYNFKLSNELMSDKLIRLAEYSLNNSLKNYTDGFSEDNSLIMLYEIDIFDNNFKLADNRLEEFIKNRPNSPFITYAALKRAYIAFQNKDYEKAQQLFAFAVVTAEDEFKARKDSEYYDMAHCATFWQGVSYFHQGRFAEAQPIFEDCYRKYPDGSYADDALFALGLSAEINKQYEIALNYYRTLSKKYPNCNNYLASKIREANIHIILKDHISAILAIDNAEYFIENLKKSDTTNQKYEPQLNVENASEELLYIKAESYNLSGNMDKSIGYYNEFMQKYPNSPMINFAKLGLAWCYLSLQQYDSSIKFYDEIIAVADSANPEISANAELYRAVALKKKGNTAEAKKVFSSLAVQPDFPLLGKALMELGQIYYETQDYENSVRTLQRAERESSEAINIIRIKLLLGANYIELRKWTSAISEYKAVEQLALKGNELFMPQKNWYLAESRLKLGISLINNSRYKEAIPSLLAFISDSKNDKRIDEAFFWLAESYYNSDMLTNAIETYDNFLKKFTNSIRKEEVLYGLGWSYFRLKKFKESSSTFDMMVTEFPESKHAMEVLARQADGYYVIKNFKKAVETYRKAVKQEPNSEEGQYCAYQMANSLYKSGSLEEAVSNLLAFVKKFPNSPYTDDALYLVGWIRFQQKNYEEAIDNFRFMISVAPQSQLLVQAKYAIGDALYNRGNFNAAISAYKEIITNYPASPLAADALRSVQYCLESEGRMDEAIALTDSLIAKNPNSDISRDLKFKKAEMFFTGKRYNDAVTEYNAFIDNYPQSDRKAEALYWMARSYISLNDTTNTEKTFEKIVKDYPNSEYAPISLLELGVFEKDINNIAKAEELFLKLQKTYPDSSVSAQAGFEIAGIKLAIADTAAALKIYKQIADKYQKNEFADQSRYRLAMYYRVKGMNDSALANFDILSKNDFNIYLAAEATYRKGEIYLSINNYQDAIANFFIVKEKFSGIEDWFSLSLLNLGQCYEATNKIDLAVVEYRALVALRPDDEFGAAAQSRLNNIENK